MRWYELLERARIRLAYAIAGPQLMALNRRCEILMGAITQVQDRNDELQHQIDGLPNILSTDEVDAQVEQYIDNMTTEEWAGVLPDLDASNAVDSYFASDEGILMLGDLLEENPALNKKLDAIIAKRMAIMTTT